MSASSTDNLIEHRLPLPSGVPVLAMGAWFKNTLCAARDGEAVVSHTLGDLDCVDACIGHEQAARTLLTWLGGSPAAIAHDLHPDFHSTRFGLQLAEECGVRAIGVQHHHAHIAAICAEHGFDGPLLGLALDGVGFGDDGTAWGGELLRVDGAHCQRLGGLRPLALPGGDRAAREPWRMAAAVLHALGRGDEIALRFSKQVAAGSLAQLLDKGVRCPPTSSMGRVFDAAAGLLGLCPVMDFEAQAAIALEQGATRFGPTRPLDDGWRIDAAGHLDLLPMLASLIDEADIERGAAVFHATVVAALFDWLQSAAEASGIGTVAFGGGCFFNKLIAAGLRQRCAAAGLHLLEAQRLLPGDTAIALGQAWVVRHHAFD
ncbi:MAG: carbamoyltransferase HypF [Rhodocyclaceae bacterium]|nr:carbamoyltransferase HypF [Rhodocyclaceae bacterium]